MKIIPIALAVGGFILVKKILSSLGVDKKNIDTSTILRLQSEKDANTLKNILIKNGAYNTNVTDSQFETIRNIFRNIADSNYINTYFKSIANVDLTTALQKSLSQSRINVLSDALTNALKQKCVITARKPTDLYYQVSIQKDGVKISRSGSVLKIFDKGVFVGRCTALKDGVITVILDNNKRYLFESAVVLVKP